MANYIEQAKTKIKLCIVMPGHWSDVMGGAQYQAARLIDVLIATDQFEIVYITRNVDAAFKPDGYKIIPIRKPPGALKKGYLFLDTFPILRALHEIKPNVIYTRIGCAYTGIAAYYAKNNHCSLVWHVSSDTNTIPYRFKLSRNMISEYIDRKIFEYGITNATQIIAQTKTQAKQLKIYFGRDVTDIIGNFHPQPMEKILKSDPVKVVWIANLKPLKQPEIFVQLANDLKSISGVNFIMIGAMQGSTRWKSKILGLIRSTENLEYLGFIPQERVNAILAESHILINTSKWEGFSNTFVQAWMRKVPVVSLHVNPDNIFDDQRLGFIAGNYNYLKKYTSTLISNGMLRQSMGEYAHQYSLRFHSEDNANKILSILTDNLTSANGVTTK